VKNKARVYDYVDPVGVLESAVRGESPGLWRVGETATENSKYLLRTLFYKD